MPNRKKAPQGFLTAQEAIARIGIPQSSFYRLVRAGTINGVILPGRKEAVYPEPAIDRYARAIQSYIDQYSDKKVYWSLALAEDTPDIRELVAAVSGGYAHTVPTEVMEAWIRKNPQALHVLRQGSEIVGYVSMFPLPLDIIMKRMSGEYWNRSIPIDDIGRFEPTGDPIRLYIAEVAVKQNMPNSRLLGARIISEIEQFLLELAEQGIIVNELYAVGTTAFGIRLCKRLGMMPLDIPEGTREDRVPFRLEITSATSPVVADYRRRIEQLPRSAATAR